jgi:glycosyltransferase involved in cell wall biosynthesis
VSEAKRRSILYLFPHPAATSLAEVQAGLAPTERLYGVIELLEKGYRVDICDTRFQGLFGGLRTRLRRFGIFLLDWGTVREIARHDVIIVKDDFALMTTLVAKLLGKRIIYLDAMFSLPRRSWRRLLTKLNLVTADAVVAYSNRQIDLWSERLTARRDRFTFLPYTVDIGFYAPVGAQANEEPYVLSVGRDLGRDFTTLVEAMRGTGLRLKLITLPYLLPPGATSESFIDIRERVSYEELFALYANAAIVVVPLTDALLYPSGIRAVLEAALLEKAVISTYTPVLEEYMTADEEIVYVRPQSVEQLRTAITTLMHDEPKRIRIQRNAKRRALSEYGMDVFARGLIETIDAS